MKTIELVLTNPANQFFIPPSDETHNAMTEVHDYQPLSGHCEQRAMLVEKCHYNKQQSSGIIHAKL